MRKIAFLLLFLLPFSFAAVAQEDKSLFLDAVALYSEGEFSAAGEMFARLLEELEAEGQLENTVIVGITDHYTYGFKDTEKLLELSGVDQELLLEKTPCFIWSPSGPDLEVSKTLNTSDLLPTVLNLLGCGEPDRYLGRDAFDTSYAGWVPFPDGSWIAQGMVCFRESDGSLTILDCAEGVAPDMELATAITEEALEFIRISNLILTTDYYRTH